MSTLKDQVLLALQGVSNKAYAKVLKKQYPILLADISAFTREYIPASVSEMIYIILHGPPPTTTCGKKLLFNTFTTGYRSSCGTKAVCECARNAQRNKISLWQKSITAEQREQMNAAAKKTFIQHYSVDNPMKSSTVLAATRESYLKKTGYDTPMTNPAVIEKIKKTINTKYNVNTPLENADIRQKGIKTTLSRYGGLMTNARDQFKKLNNGQTPFQVSSIKQKIQQTMQERYCVDSPKHFHLSDYQISILTNKEKFIQLVSGKTLTQAGIDLGVAATTIGNRVRMYNIRDLIASPNRSRHEVKISELLTELGVKFIRNERTLCFPQQVDFFLPSVNIAIEVGSLFWHSNDHAGREQEYHWSKWKKCHDHGVDLYQWFDDELDEKWEIIKDKIIYLTKTRPVVTIGARKCSIQRLVRSTEKSFLNQHHIQGDAWDRDLALGAYYCNELVGLLAVKKRRNQLEVTRYCTAQGRSVVGLFSKLLKAAVSELNFTGEVFSFSNNLHSNGNLYQAAGFTISSHVKPAYWYTQNYHTRLHRQNFTRAKIAKKFNILIDGKSELELMRSLGFDRIWDAGKIRWSLLV